MNCRDAIRLLYDVVDHEATDHDTSHVLKHIETCEKCAARFEMEQAFKKCIEQKGNLSPDCHELEEKIKSQLDAIDDAAGEVGTFKPPFRWLAVGLAAAAAIIITFFAASSVNNFYRQQTQFVPFVKAHFAGHVDHRIDHPAADPFDFLFQHIGIRLTPSPQLSIDDIRSIAIDTIKGIPFGRIELAAADGDVVTLFVTSQDRYHLPDGPCRQIDGSEMVVHCCDKCTLVGCAKKDLVFMTVAARHHEPAELARLTAAF